MLSTQRKFISRIQVAHEGDQAWAKRRSDAYDLRGLGTSKVLRLVTPVALLTGLCAVAMGYTLYLCLIVYFRSASARKVHKRRKPNLGNCACKFRFANERRARRQFVSNCLRARVEMVIFGSRGQNAKSSASIARSLEYRDAIDCARSFNAMYVGPR
eukprot:3871818-Pleurochrysis_carterae.AAC.1